MGSEKQFVSLAKVATISGESINPGSFPGEHFELFSIPAYSRRQPELVLGSDIKSNKTLIHPADVLVSKLNPRIPRVWRVGVGGGLRQVCSTEFIPFRVNDPTILSPDYLAWTLLSPQFMSPLQDSARSSTRSHERVRPNEIASQLIPIPSIVEQHRIVDRIKDCMQRVDEIEALCSQQSVLHDHLLRATRRQYLGLPSSIPIGWTESRLDELADVIYGISAAISANRDPRIGPPIIRMANISKEGHLDLSDLRYCAIPRGKEQHFGLRRGDLLLNWRSGSADHVGKTAIFDTDGTFTCASFILRIRVKLGLCDNRYLRHVLNFMRAEGIFSGLSRMQINHKLNAKEFSAFPIRVPIGLSEQERIADQLDAAESIILKVNAGVETQPEEINRLQRAILSKAFGGEL